MQKLLRNTAIALLAALNVIALGYGAAVLKGIHASATPVTVFEADYYQVEGQKNPTKPQEFAIISVKDKKTAKLQWNNGRLDFIDGGLPMTDSARQFLILSANTYNQMVIEQNKHAVSSAGSVTPAKK